MHNNKYIYFKSTPLTIHNKIIFIFECPMAWKQSIVSQPETSNEIISIKALQ